MEEVEIQVQVDLLLVESLEEVVSQRGLNWRTGVSKMGRQNTEFFAGFN